ncbi:MAG TPA: hypothetical protein PK239_18115 [Chitinophagales bacterium]|nr:hypothetical protein [Chitinophagales bacterium]HRK29196.1 hypothetical protein [Chitinophagales bacterium]
MTEFKPAAIKQPLFLFVLSGTHVVCLLVLFLFMGCSGSYIYKRYITLPDGGVWNTGERIRFVAAVTPKQVGNAEVNVTLLIRHATAYEYPNLLLKLRIKEPEQTLFTEYEYDLPIKKPNGTNAGSGMGNTWDIKFPLLQNKPLLTKPGNYTFELEHLMPTEQLFLIKEVGLLIERGGK